MDSSMASRLDGAFEALREKLIDKSLRNRMINFRPSPVLGLIVEKESPSEIWRQLVAEGRKLGFTGPPDPVKKEGEEAPPPPPAPVDNSTTDALLYCPDPKTRRHSKLLVTWRAALEQLEERGVNSLYLALGMLEWKEPGEEASHRAPLVLVPASLERTGRGDFRLAYDEGEIGSNLSLKARLGDLGVSLPDIPQDLDSFSVEAYFDEAASAVSQQPEWTIHRTDVALGFFSFEKIALYNDLDLRPWPQEEGPLRHRDILAILGEGYPPLDTPFSEGTDIDVVRPPEEGHEVFPADSSQLLVLLEAQRGSSMVVEGPPGTGKSQTIANLIAELVSRGKRVLFVSEKAAALNVVHRRLEEAGLDQACLNLHGHKSSRRAFFDEIRATWSRRASIEEAARHYDRLTELRGRLNGYVHDLHQPLEGIEASPRRLIGLAAGLPPVSDPELHSGYAGTSLAGASWSRMAVLRRTIQSLQQKAREIGRPASHPFWGSRVDFFGPQDRFHADASLASLESLSARLADRAGSLAAKLSVPPPETLGDLDVLNRCLLTALSAPPLDGVALKVETWSQEEQQIRQTSSTLRELQAIRAAEGRRLKAEAWERDWEEDAQAVEKHGGSFFGRFSGDYRRAAAALRACISDGQKPRPDEAMDLAGKLRRFQVLRSQIQERDAVMARLYGVQWKGALSAPDQLERLLDWMLKLGADMAGGLVPGGLLAFFTGSLTPQSLQGEYDEAESLRRETAAQITSVAELLQLPERDPMEWKIAEAARQSRLWRQSLSRISEIISWNLAAREAEGLGLEGVVGFASQWPAAGDLLETHVLRVWSEGALKAAFQSRPSLKRFERAAHEQSIEEFRQLDETVLHHNRARVIDAHLKGLPVAGTVGLSADLARQCELKRGHKSIRWAFTRLGDLLLSIKPVCMMSPLSVAAFLPRTAGLFDVVVFDEASQVKPEDALSAIARARQVIVVGDSRQMPPTSFFQAMMQDGGGDEEDEDGAVSAVGRMESILALCRAACVNTARTRELKWHYRSLHQSLIQPSNTLFYDDGLVIFPSPVSASPGQANDLGIRFRHDPDTVYDRGAAKKVNMKQAEAAARQAAIQLKERPHESLMIVAFSKDQQEAIRDRLEAILEPGATAEYDALHPYERFDVKNLETVQGDERDVVFISVGYGRDAKGAMTHNFGPLNKDGGGRRLNVLMSRARRRIEVFTSIRSTDIAATEAKDSGPSALKTFLEFAETGILPEAAPEPLDQQLDLELQIKAALEAKGWTVESGVGASSYRVDLAVRHPERPDLYALGIECDGAHYGSARSARDRDRLRWQALTARGWILHRVWSSDWWLDRDTCLVRLDEALGAAVRLHNERAVLSSRPEPSAQEEPQIEVWNEEGAPTGRQAEPYRAWDQPIRFPVSEFWTLPSGILSDPISWIVNAEGPIHVELLIKRLRESAGFARAGSRIREAILAGLENAAARGLVAVQGQFVHRPGQESAAVRSRQNVPAQEKKLEWIAPEEITAAVLQVAEEGRIISEPQAVDGARRALGFSKSVEGLAAAVQKALADLVDQGVLAKEGGEYRAGDRR